jgi:hypothetical protein
MNFFINLFVVAIIYNFMSHGTISPHHHITISKKSGPQANSSATRISEPQVKKQDRLMEQQFAQLSL